MTKVKVKGSFLSKPAEKGRPAAEDYPVDEEDDGQDDLEGKTNNIPFVNANSKGKRGPRGAGRPTHRDSSGLQSSDSALGTSSSRGLDDDDDDTGDSAHNESGQDHGSMDNAAIDSARRGSIRVKVKPSKFRENSHATPEGRSPLKKKHGAPPLDSPGYKQLIHARDYTLANQQGHLPNELSTALMVVKKIMRMDAAEPFNIPVDPVALGIPDYFDIVKRPMDLGTICKTLERGGKYRSSQDVYEDVQLVWTNCRIYNQKGDPILDLLARVKKNFMKYWTAAGLYTEKSPANFKFRGGSNEAEFDGSSLKQREMQEEADYGRGKKMNKFVRDSQSPANSMAKISPKGESKSLKLHPPEYVGGFRREQDAASTVANDEIDTYYSNREGPKVISVYKTHKKKLLEQQENEHLKEAGPKVYEQEVEQKPVGRGLIMVKHPHADKMTKPKEIDLQGTPGKSRRVSGTGHHKADCSCVVCTGVRRKLAREGKLPSHLVYAPGMADSQVAQEKILVRLKAEGSSDRPKSHHGKPKAGKRKEIDDRERAESASAKKKELDDSEMASMDADDLEKGTEKNEEFGKVAIKEEGKAYSESEGKLEVVKAGDEEEYKGVGEEMDEREDGMQIDELGDMPDAEKEHQEGGVKYYRASYEIPLRKINPSILQIGQQLFGDTSPWSRGRSLRRPPSTRFSESPILATVALLLSSKAT
ncbi:hypothetical protein GOP47_0019980 [Adiantum capillus-veneris]|uniref:Bromo domain-containing protein n=1 Tax=Adiantum capillus-veneris TaxID=13818 RepID=A0A9D4UCC2_ADICA|nr:hypothetical protein GOP47_0019980 [Adiantum capillus-veneris]